MYETLKMMKSILTGKEKETKEEDLIREYQLNKAPNILAFMYVNHFGIIKSISEYYCQLDSQDKASFCLQEIDKSLLDYNFTNKYSTFFATYYKNRLRMEVAQLNTSNKKILFNTVSLENIDVNEFKDLSLEDEELILNQYNLNDKQKTICRFLNKGYKLKEIAMTFNTSISNMSNQRQKIIKKLLLEV